MKRTIAFVLTGIMALSLAACSSAPAEESTASSAASESAASSMSTPASEAAESSAPSTVSVATMNEANEEVYIDVPYDPQTVVVIDFAGAGTLDMLGLGDRIVGMSKDGMGEAPAYLAEMVANEDIADVGMFIELNYEEIARLAPDVIISGDRGSADNYATLSEIAPTVILGQNSSVESHMESTEKNAMKIGTIFGMEEEVTAAVEELNTRVAALREVGEQNNMLSIFVEGDAISTLGNYSRSGLLPNDLGFENLAADEDAANPHGTTSSFETILELNPQYLFVGGGTSDDADVAFSDQFLDNEIIMQTDAYANDQIVFLPNDYVGALDVKSVDMSLSALEEALLA